MRKQQGFTSLELIIVMVFGAAVAFAGFGVYVAWHFIAKVW